MVHISLEGPVGVGKSTALRLLDVMFKPAGVTVFQEPIDTWKTLLKPFYDERTKGPSPRLSMIAAALQLKVLQSYEERYPKHDRFVISERSIYTGINVFVPMMRKDKTLSDTSCLSMLDFFYSKTTLSPPDHYIFLTGSLESIMDRISRRNRPGEEDIDRSFICDMIKMHDAYFRALGKDRAEQLDIDDPAFNQKIVKSVKKQVLIGQHGLCKVGQLFHFTPEFGAADADVLRQALL